MRPFKHSCFIVVALALLLGLPASAQTAARVANDPLAESRAALMEATREYKASTEALLQLEESEVQRTASTLEQLRQLYTGGILARREWEESESALGAAQARLAELRAQIADADRMMAELHAAEELARIPPPPAPARNTPANTGSYSATAVILRYSGPANWTVANLSGLQAFYSASFGRALPTSAVGQTATHNRLGFDHRHAVDVALHPDSREGQALIAYLRSQGIPFIAFRAAVPGSATGPHIHIGRPSSRL